MRLTNEASVYQWLDDGSACEQLLQRANRRLIQPTYSDRLNGPIGANFISLTYYL